MTAPATAADRRALVWLLLAALLVLGAGIGLRDPWPSDEPRFALVAQTMVDSGDWLFPRRGSELYPDKPPLFMWLQALAYLVVRDWRVAFLLPSLLAGLGTLWLVWDLGRRLFTPRAGLLSTIAVLAALMFAFQFKRAQIDPLVTFLITFANWGLIRHLVGGPHWRLFWLGCFAAGLGVIAKGVGVLALLLLLPYGLARWRGWQHLTTTARSGWRWAGGALAFLAAIALWLLPVAAAAVTRGTPEYADYLRQILFDQTARRYTGQVGGHYGRGWWYFVVVVVLHFFPLSLAYGSAARHEWRSAWAGRDGRHALLLGWCALVLLFFTLAAGKREVYVLPLLPMLAVALGPTLLRIEHAAWLRGAALAATLVFGLGFVAAGLAAWPGRWPRMNELLLERGLDAQARTLALCLVAAGVFFLLCAAAGRLRRAVPALLAGLAGFWVWWGMVVAPVANDAVSSADVMRNADRIAGPGGEIALVAWKEQNLLMSPRRPVDFGFRTPPARQFERALRWAGEAPDRRWLFAPRELVQRCIDPAQVRLAGWSNRTPWAMFRAAAVQPGCELPGARASGDDGD